MKLTLEISKSRAAKCDLFVDTWWQDGGHITAILRKICQQIGKSFKQGTVNIDEKKKKIT